MIKIHRKFFIFVIIIISNFRLNSANFIAPTFNLLGKYENPAQIMDFENFKINLGYENYQNIDNLYNLNFSIYKNLNFFYTGFSYYKMLAKLEYHENKFNTFDNNIFNFYLNFPLRSKVFTGIILTYPFIKIRDYNFNGLDISAGAIYTFYWGNFGILLKNIYTHKKYNWNIKEYIAGISILLPIPDIQVRLFSDITYSNKLTLGLGMDYNFKIHNNIELLLELSYRENFNLGVSFLFNYFQLNYIANFINNIGVKNFVSIGINF